MRIKKYTLEYTPLSKDFECGNVVIDQFLKSSSALDENQGITYIMMPDEQDLILGYYNIAMGRVDYVETTEDVQAYEPMGGAVNINYLAVHSRFQKKKLAEYEGKNIYFGDYLLRDCEKRVIQLREKIGVAFITLASTKEGYHLYHDRNCYEEFESDMNIVVQESDMSCRKMYKYVDDLVS